VFILSSPCPQWWIPLKRYFHLLYLYFIHVKKKKENRASAPIISIQAKTFIGLRVRILTYCQKPKS